MAHSILIVDDEPGIRQSLTGVLEDEGFAVTTAASGEECLQAFEQRLYACVLLDVWLPGIDLIRDSRAAEGQLPRHQRRDDLGSRADRHRMSATKLGAYDFIEKPLSLEKTVALASKTRSASANSESWNSELREKLNAVTR